MNWLLIVVAVIVIGNMLWGLNKGFFRVIYSMVAGILILALAVGGTPFLAGWLTDNTTVDTKIEQGCKERLEKLMEGDSGDKESETKEKKAKSKDKASQETELEKLQEKIPEKWLEQLLDPNELADDYLEKHGVYDTLAARASELAVRGIAFLILLIVVSIVSGTLASVFDLVTRLPLIEDANRLLGLAAGLIKGILWVWLAFAVIALGSATEIGMTLIKTIYESQILTWVYENNILLILLMKFL